MFYKDKIWNKEEYKKFKDSLYSLSDKKYKEFSIKLKASDDEILGIRLPILRRISKQIVKTNIYSFLANIRYDTYEEKLISSFVIAYSKIDLNEKIKLIDDFVKYINSWAICDSFVSTLKFISKERELFIPIIEKYILENKEFTVRFSVVVFLWYYIDEKYIDYVLDKLSSIKNNSYYCKMAIAWALCECYIFDKDKTLKYMNESKFSIFVHNKAISKICDSLKVSKEEKIILKKLKK